ncbi:MAG: SAM-dependent DNA methyltransferase [Anaerolineales bacterium]|nr:SAM-dependent DNA methyltransferase [Anaerolineales bacterium]
MIGRLSFLVEQQVVSKKRVADHGEVFTSPREVNAMLDLVKQETERIDSRFLEPACGTGNFLIEILNRKLRIVAKKYRKSQLDYERNLISAISSIYGIDILEDNVMECRQRLFDLANEAYTTLFKKKAKNEVRRALQFILEKNIIWGDALDLRTVSQPIQQIIFSEWSFPFNNSLLKRRDFVFAELIPDGAKKNNQLDLFSKNEHVSDLGEKVFLPTETRSYPLVHFLKIGEGGND